MQRQLRLTPPAVVAVLLSLALLVVLGTVVARRWARPAPDSGTTRILQRQILRLVDRALLPVPATEDELRLRRAIENGRAPMEAQRTFVLDLYH